jgi:uncharacterized protein (DUF1919 family)
MKQVFYKLILDREIILEDLKDFDKIYYKNLLEIKNKPLKDL